MNRVPIGYRELVVKQVIDRPDGGKCLCFYDCVTSIELPQRYVNQFGLKEIKKEDHVILKGTRGNEDVVLASPGSVADIQVWTN